jgi:hypothetical protein
LSGIDKPGAALRAVADFAGYISRNPIWSLWLD